MSTSSRKIAVVTGASSGIGAVYAGGLAKPAYDMVLVDAALSALDQGETVTWPSVADAELFAHFEAARFALFAASQTGKVAPRLLPA